MPVCKVELEKDAQIKAKSEDVIRAAFQPVKVVEDPHTYARQGRQHFRTCSPYEKGALRRLFRFQSSLDLGGMAEHRPHLIMVSVIGGYPAVIRNFPGADPGHLGSG